MLQRLLRRGSPLRIELQELADKVGERFVFATVVGQHVGYRADVRAHAAQISIVLAHQPLRRPPAASDASNGVGVGRAGGDGGYASQGKRVVPQQQGKRRTVSCRSSGGRAGRSVTCSRGTAHEAQCGRRATPAIGSGGAELLQRQHSIRSAGMCKRRAWTERLSNSSLPVNSSIRMQPSDHMSTFGL